MAAPLPARLPVSTYRLQLSPSQNFAAAAELASYLSELGISECYCSPVFAARPGSAHGYDICDHSRADPQLGGDDGFHAMSDAFRSRDLGLLLDFVPNHMSTHPLANPWWRSVLESGPSSPYARYFDIDWNPVKHELRDRILLPILGDQYGVTLEQGQLRLAYEDGAIRLRLYELDLPLNPRRLGLVVGHRLDDLRARLPADDPDLTELLSVLFHLDHLPPYTETDPTQMAERQREKDVALGRLAALLERSEVLRAHLEENLRRFNGRPGEPSSFELMHELLEGQPYRLASWRTAMHEINYRRFFDVNELAGIRMEEPEVFAAAHALTARWVREGRVTGLRLDHVDGLFDPAGYLDDLAGLLGPAPVWTVVEKILSEGERLDPSWRTHGTTGYEYLNQLNGIFVDPVDGVRLKTVYQAFTGRDDEFAEVCYQSKKLIVTTSMASELNVLAAELNRISEGRWQWRDFTLDSLQEALRQVVACFPVYRTYVRGEGWTAEDEAAVDRAIASALRRNPALEPTIFHFLRRMLLPQPDPAIPEPELRRRLRFAMKFQQYTGPVQAKGVEDTAFYRFGPLLSLNEVGGEPERFGPGVERFHRTNAERLARWPLTLLATATHDTKRGEDARARLNALSEMPVRWRALLNRWSRINAPARETAETVIAPDRGDEYLFYQSLLGMWPPLAQAADESLVERIHQYLLKAMREAKIHTSWINPSAAYEEAVGRFVRSVLLGEQAAAFHRSFAPFARELARTGAVNSLAQMALKLASPGVADVYQGTELWDLSLVDPDNRRPVDFAARRRHLAELVPLSESAGRGDPVAGDVGALLEHWPDGRVKMYLTLVGLRYRRRCPDLFLRGEYLPLTASGARADHLVGFARRNGDQAAVALAPRLVADLASDRWPTGSEAWGDTVVPLPASLHGFSWRNSLTGERQGPGASLAVSAALATLPIALLEGSLSS